LVTYNVNIDVGGTRTKFIISQAGQYFQSQSVLKFQLPTVMIFALPPNRALQCLVEVLNANNVSKSNINQVVFSVTGFIDSKSGAILSSDRLKEYNKEWEQYPLKHNFAVAMGVADSVISVINDCVAASLGSFHYVSNIHRLSLPLLVLVLGTYPTVGYVDADSSNVKLYQCECWVRLEIGITTGVAVIYQSINSKAYTQLVKDEPETARIRYSQRVCRALRRIIQECTTSLKKPRTVVIMGGLSTQLFKPEEITKEVGIADIKIVTFENDESQSNVHLQGCILYPVLAARLTIKAPPNNK